MALYNAVELLVALTFFGIWFTIVRDNSLFDQLPTLPENFVYPESLSYKWPHYEITYVNSIGLKMATYKWLPKGQPRALVFLVPGYADYSDYNANVANLLVNSGYATFGIDPEGHGRSEGLRGYIDDLNRSCSDILEWIRLVKKDYPSTKTFLWGQSLGGAMALRMMLVDSTPFSGMIVTAPAIKASEDLYPMLRHIARVVSFFAPTLAVAPPLSENALCGDERVDMVAKSDPLQYNGRMRAKSGVQMLDMFGYLQQHLEEITVPFMVLHSELDTIIKVSESSQLLYERAGSKDKTFKLIKGELHNFLSSLKYKEYVQEIIHWLDVHTS